MLLHTTGQAPCSVNMFHTGLPSSNDLGHDPILELHSLLLISIASSYTPRFADRWTSWVPPNRSLFHARDVTVAPSRRSYLASRVVANFSYVKLGPEFVDGESHICSNDWQGSQLSIGRWMIASFFLIPRFLTKYLMIRARRWANEMPTAHTAKVMGLELCGSRCKVRNTCWAHCLVRLIRLVQLRRTI